MTARRMVLAAGVAIYSAARSAPLLSVVLEDAGAATG